MFYPSYILLSSFVVINACGAAIEPSTDIVSINNANRKILNYIDQEKDRHKRASPNFFSLVKEKVTSGIKSKIGEIASSSKHFSGGSSGEHHSEPVYYDHDPNIYEHYHHPEYHSAESFEGKSFDFWDLQKSILHTLLQAAKAIKGGLIAVKGHLIKGSGYVISAKGKLLSAQGEAITNLGKHLASTAVLSPYPPHHHIEHHPEFEHEYSHEHSQHQSYSPSSYHHEQPQHFEALMKSPKGVHGILVLQKIPKTQADDFGLNGNHGEHSLHDSLDYIHQSDQKSNLKSAIKNYLLSNSHNKLNPSNIHHTYGDNKFSDISLQSHHDDFPTHEFHKESSEHFEPTPNSVDYQDFKYESSIQHKFNDNASIHPEHLQSNNNNPKEPAYASNLKPQSTNYGVPFELDDNFDKFHTSSLDSHTAQQTKLNLTPLSELETYEPLHFPDKTAHYMLQRPENFVKHPVELSNNLNVNKNLHSDYSHANHLLNHFNKYGSLPELEVSASEHKPSVYPKRVEQRYKNKRLNNKNIVSNKSRRTRYSPNVTKRKLPSHNKVLSRPPWTQGPLTK